MENYSPELQSKLINETDNHTYWLLVQALNFEI